MSFRKCNKLLAIMSVIFMLIGCSACSQKPSAEELAKELPAIEALNYVKFPRTPVSYTVETREDGTTTYRVAK